MQISCKAPPDYSIFVKDLYLDGHNRAGCNTAHVQKNPLRGGDTLLAVIPLASQTQPNPIPFWRAIRSTTDLHESNGSSLCLKANVQSRSIGCKSSFQCLEQCWTNYHGEWALGWTSRLQAPSFQTSTGPLGLNQVDECMDKVSNQGRVGITNIHSFQRSSRHNSLYRLKGQHEDTRDTLRSFTHISRLGT